MPWASSSSSRESPSQPGKEKWALAASRPSGVGVAVEHRVGDRVQHRRRPARRAARRPRGRTSSRRSAASGPAVANAATAGTSSVPERTSRSCPPPCSSGHRRCTSRRSSSAPMPYGPPTLWPVTVIASSPLAAKSTRPGRTPGPRRSAAGRRTRAQRRRVRGSAKIVPTSLLAHITVTRATSSGSRSSASRSVCGMHPAVGVDRQPLDPRRPRARRASATASSTAWCSTGLASTRVRAGSAARRAQYRPLTARLSASVPPRGEHDLAGPGAERRGERLPGLLDGTPGPAAGRVQRRGVAR